jgi:hypothetical protein
MNSKVKGIVLGGVIGGLLSVIPFISMGNCFCCMWVILGGALAAAVHAKGAGRPVGLGEGTLVGLLAGVVMILIYLVIGLPLNFVLGQVQNVAIGKLITQFTGDPAIEMQMAAQAGQTFVQQLLGAAIGLVMFTVLGAAFSSLGGLIGTAIFADKDPYGGHPGYPDQDFPDQRQPGPGY